MGNLFTHIVKGRSRRLEILSKLKYLYRCTPRDYTEINKLKKELQRIEKNQSMPKRKKLKGIFDKGL